MKKASIIFFALFILFTQNSCRKEKFYRLDHSNWFVFNTGDTLLYKSSISRDTFLIESIINEFDIVDKSSFYEMLRIYFKKLNSTNTYYFGYDITRSYNSTIIVWKYLVNSIHYGESRVLEYSIGNVIIEDVYEVALSSNPPFPVRYDDDVILVYYSDKYGIIAYKLANGLVFELDEAYLKSQLSD